MADRSRLLSPPRFQITAREDRGRLSPHSREGSRGCDVLIRPVWTVDDLSSPELSSRSHRRNSSLEAFTASKVAFAQRKTQIQSITIDFYELPMMLHLLTCLASIHEIQKCSTRSQRCSRLPW